LRVAFCPSVDNVDLKGIRKWVFNYTNPEETYGIFDDGTRFDPIKANQCGSLCPDAAGKLRNVMKV